MGAALNSHAPDSTPLECLHFANVNKHVAVAVTTDVWP